jgi:hypothetical protein
MAAAGRRSYKTEIAKRKLFLRSMVSTRPNAWFVAAAPTWQQAKDIYWRDLKEFYHPEVVQGISESELTIFLDNGARVSTRGLDNPARIEGPLLDGIILDEFGNMKADVWDAHVLPALSNFDREGWAIFVGTPEGRNHYYDLFTDADLDTSGEWATFQWKSSLVMDPKEVARRKATMDPRLFEQEYEGSFVSFEGLVYYNFDRQVHAAEVQEYDPNRDLIFAFDFNREPGVAAILQDYWKESQLVKQVGELYIARDSNTEKVAQALIHGSYATTRRRGWGDHPGRVLCYGDATGGAGGSAKVAGSDWDILRKHLGGHFGSRLRFRVPKANPRERVRVNSVNAAFRTADDQVHYLVSPECRYTTKDFESVQTTPDGSGDILKEPESMLTHISDGIGYYFAEAHPVRTPVSVLEVA